MAECRGRNGVTKRRHKNRQQAEAAANKAASIIGKELHAYKCPNCGGWHLTSKQETTVKVQVPSSAKLRRKLQAYGALIATQQRRFDESEAKLAAAKAKAEQENAEVLAALEVMSTRSYGRRL